MNGTKFLRRFFNTHANLPEHLTEFLEKRTANKCFDNYFISKCKVLSAPTDSGTMLVEIKVDESLVNVNGSIHGGIIASLVDFVSTGALFNSKTRKTGVSVDMNLSYIKPAKLNETILIEGKVLKAGSKLAFLTASVYKKDIDQLHLSKKEIIATCSHTKYIV